MLTQEEFLKSLYFKSLCQPVDFYKGPKQLHALIEVDSGRIVAASAWHATMLSLSNVVLNSNILWHTYVQGKIPQDFNNTRPWQCRWNINNDTFYLDDSALDYDKLYQYNLIVEKSAALDMINFRLYYHRRFLWNDQLLQPTVYHMKYLSARDYLSQTKPVTDPQHWPLVYDYAEFAGLDLDTAANEIVFQYRLWETRISNTESIRLKFTKLVSECTDILEISKIVQSFQNENDLYARM